MAIKAVRSASRRKPAGPLPFKRPADDKYACRAMPARVGGKFGVADEKSDGSGVS
ncbi:MAG: hypothetical protein ABFD81_12675 [Syntrophaceae bacterium]